MRPQMPIIQLEEQSHLKGRRLEFESIAQMLTIRSNETPDVPHVYYYDQILTYKDTNDRANQVANFLKEKGIKKGDIVAVMILNAPEIYYAMWGAQKLGAIAIAMNYCLKAPEIAYVLNDSKPKVIFVGSDYMDEFTKGFEKTDSKPYVVEVVTKVKHESIIAQKNMTDILDKYPIDECLVKQSLDDPFMLLYSSGTTGEPKGVLLSNRSQLSQCRNFNRQGYIKSNDIMMIMLPMFHANPLCVFTYPVSYAGQALCIRTKYSTYDFWSAVMQYGITIIMGVPTMFEYILNKVDPINIDMLKVKIRYAFTGGAAISSATRRGFKEKFNIDILVGYGLTEGCGGNTTEPALGRFKEGSCGMTHSEEQIEIMDSEGNILPNNVDGEVCIKGDCVMMGYLNKPEQFAEIVRDGFLHTGDIGHFDDEGYLYIVERKRDVIVRGGEKVYSRYIEIVLEEHPMVAEVAVIGVPDKCLGQRIKAYIVPKQKNSMTAEATRQWLLERMAKYRVPEFYEFVDRLPRTPSGKIQKFELRKANQQNN
ncbi:Long-chain-fatty-acid--CoA ligase FadD13 [Sporomusa silvacetica DSM 10669]|uniref:Long-chain-fatty-acid--CoA ligase FadD13 n=1 Tax=Sporomusa silvacetica DSM 10669 TaxID=1123289 RepID=A0ABZ3IFK5_9FIRM|nr:class I adenylate-forming enzyme family protein [Sporomusa silvacetica]OZC17152.1 long-chain-fatty-acid--CoA ligase FadD13 [Sporomusa silvacetica DSM 10669]